MATLATKTTAGGVLGDVFKDRNGTWRLTRVISAGVYAWSLDMPAERINDGVNAPDDQYRRFMINAILLNALPFFRDQFMEFSVSATGLLQIRSTGGNYTVAMWGAQDTALNNGTPVSAASAPTVSGGFFAANLNALITVGTVSLEAANISTFSEFWLHIQNGPTYKIYLRGGASGNSLCAIIERFNHTSAQLGSFFTND